MHWIMIGFSFWNYATEVIMKPPSGKTIDSIADDLSNLRCTSGLSLKARTLLASVAVKRNFPSNEYIWEMGDPGDFIVIISNGLVEISRYTLAEEEMTIGIFGPSDVIGLSAVLKKTTYPGSAKTLMKNCELIKVYLRPVLQDKGELVAEIQTWIKEMVLHHEQVLRDKIDILNAGSVENRVFELLSHLIRRFGTQESRLQHFIPIRLTRAQIGKLIDVRVETVIRLISRWKKQKLITWKDSGILIPNLPLLEKSLLKNKNSK